MTRQEAQEHLEKIAQDFYYNFREFDTLMEIAAHICTNTFDDDEPKLSPGDPENCRGNGEYDYECYCDDCDHYRDCFPKDKLPFTYRGYTVEQMENRHLWLEHEDGSRVHINCTKILSEDELQNTIDELENLMVHKDERSDIKP